MLIHSLYHSNLYKFHVLNDDSIPDPGFPSFYPREFFAKIIEVHMESPLNVATMTQKHWYTLLLEDCCIKEYRGMGPRSTSEQRLSWQAQKQIGRGHGGWRECRAWVQNTQRFCSSFYIISYPLKNDYTGQIMM